MTAPAGGPPQPDPKTLNGEQLQGWNCALCNARLFADRSLGKVTIDYGHVTETYELWACRPSCPPPPPSHGQGAT